MALFTMILRKMIKNKWLEISMLIGLVLTVALVSSMPIYTQAILQRMLVKDLQILQQKENVYPGSIYSSVHMTPRLNVEGRVVRIGQIDDFMKHEVVKSFGLPAKVFVQARSSDIVHFDPADPTEADATFMREGMVSAWSGLEKHIRLIDGRMPAKEPVNGVYEAIVTTNALMNLKLALNVDFVYHVPNSTRTVTVKPVGVFNKKTDDDLYWNGGNLSVFNTQFVIDYDLFDRDFLKGNTIPVTSCSWYFALDYNKMELGSIDDYNITTGWIKNVLAHRFVNHNMETPALKVLSTYEHKETMLRKTLWSLNAPVLIMLAFYLYMVANLIMERQKTEIAVLRSRGASRLQILMGFVIEGIVLGGIALLIGPFLGMAFTRVVGASNGFMEFVQRSALHVKLTPEAYMYALVAIGGSIVMTLIPAFIATRVTIVGHKQQVTRQKGSFWHRIFLDVILLAISWYGLHNFRTRTRNLLELGIDSNDFSIDPLLFLIPALFILGVGLFILRIYPLFIRLIYWLGRKWWPPSMYSTLIQVGRSSVQYQFLMIFLIITISTGLFSASAARTINLNSEQKVLYKDGAEIVFTSQWQNDAPPPAPSMGGGSASSTPKKMIQYTEPPFEPLKQLPGVQSMARVFVKQQATYVTGVYSGTATLMGIDTDDFGRTAWFKDHLLPYHLNAYLNLIAKDPSAVLISRSLAKEEKLKIGDTIKISWDTLDMRDVVVYGIIDYFPTFNPNIGSKAKDEDPGKAPRLIVASLSYIQSFMWVEPYEYWVKLKNEAGAEAQFSKALVDNNVPVTSFMVAKDDVREIKNDPFHLSINGVMTLGFLISIIICFFGFLLYWILSLYGRILQTGILRAMGISFPQLIGMLAAEQVLTSGAAIGIGVIIGNVVSKLYVPLFQLSFNPGMQVPPFEVIIKQSDMLQIYTSVTLMVATGLTILGYMMSRIKIHQAVKLGED